MLIDSEIEEDILVTQHPDLSFPFITVYTVRHPDSPASILALSILIFDPSCISRPSPPDFLRYRPFSCFQHVLSVPRTMVFQLSEQNSGAKYARSNDSHLSSDRTHGTTRRRRRLRRATPTSTPRRSTTATSTTSRRPDSPRHCTPSVIQGRPNIRPALLQTHTRARHEIIVVAIGDGDDSRTG